MGQVYGLYPDEEERKKPSTGLSSGTSGTNKSKTTGVMATSSSKTGSSKPVLPTPAKTNPPKATPAKTTPTSAKPVAIASSTSTSKPVTKTNRFDTGEDIGGGSSTGKSTASISSISSSKPVTKPNRFDNGEDIGTVSGNSKSTGSDTSRIDKAMAETEALRSKGVLTQQEKQKYNDNLTYLKTAAVYEKQQGSGTVIANYLKGMPQQNTNYNTPEYYRELRSASPVDAALFDAGTLLNEDVLTTEERKRLDQNLSTLSKAMNDSRASVDLKDAIEQTLNKAAKQKQKELGIDAKSPITTGKPAVTISAVPDDEEDTPAYPLTMAGLRMTDNAVQAKRQAEKDALPDHVGEALATAEELMRKPVLSEDDVKNYKNAMQALYLYSSAEKIGVKEGDPTPVTRFLSFAPKSLAETKIPKKEQEAPAPSVGKNVDLPPTMAGLRMADNTMQAKKQAERDALPGHVRVALETAESFIVKGVHSKEDEESYLNAKRILDTYSAGERVGNKAGDPTPVMDFLQYAPKKIIAEYDEIKFSDEQQNDLNLKSSDIELFENVLKEQKSKVKSIENSKDTLSADEYNDQMSLAKELIYFYDDLLTQSRNAKYYSEKAYKKENMEEYAKSANNFESVSEKGSKNLLNFISHIYNNQETVGYVIDRHSGTDKGLKYFLIEPDEMATYNYYYGIGDMKSANEYMSILNRQLDERQWKKSKKHVESVYNDKTKPRELIAAGTDFVSSILSPIPYFENLYQAGKNKITGEYEPTNKYTKTMNLVRIGDMSEDYLTKDKNEVVGALIKGVLSAGESMVKTAVIGPAGAKAHSTLASMGESTVDLLDRDASPDQAASYSTAVGAVSFVMDQLADSLGKDVGKNELQKVFAKAGIKGTTKVLFEESKFILDEEFNKSRSKYNERVRELMDQSNLSEAEAENKASREFVLEFFTSALSSMTSKSVSEAAKSK